MCAKPCAYFPLSFLILFDTLLSLGALTFYRTGGIDAGLSPLVNA